MKYTIFVAAALLALSTILSGCSPEETKAEVQTTERAVDVVTVLVAPSTIRDVLTLPGETEPDKDVRVSAERAGDVEEVAVTEGDEVKKGDVLAKIDVAGYKAECEKTEAMIDFAEKQLVRRRKLAGQNVLAQEELDEAATELARLEAVLRKSRFDFEQGVVLSPIDGVINMRHVDPGEHVQTGAPMFDIVNARKVRVNINVPEMDVRWIKKGDSVNIAVDAYPERSWKGVVDFVSLKADEASKTFPVRIIVENDDLAVRPGMLARAALLKRTIPKAVTAPLFALVDRGGERLLFIEEDGVAKARTVEIGVVSKDRVQIVKGLAHGENLIVSGQNKVEDGTKVAVK